MGGTLPGAVGVIEVEVDGAIQRLTVEEFERRVALGELSSRTLICYPAVTGNAFVEAGSLELYRALLEGEGERFRTPFTLRRVPVLTLFFLVACVVSTALGLWEGGDLLSQGAKSRAHVLELGEWWRLLTACLLHSTWLHLFFNATYTAYLGWSVESAYGRGATAVILVSSGLCSMLLSLLLVERSTVGASGVTFGLLGAAVVFGWRYGDQLPRGVRGRFGFAVFPFLLYFLLAGLRNPAIDNVAHIGGLLGGGAAASLCVPNLLIAPLERRGLSIRRGGWAIMAALAVVLMGPSLGGPLGLVGLPPIDHVVGGSGVGYELKVPSYWLEGLDARGWRAHMSPTRGIRLASGSTRYPRPVKSSDLVSFVVEDLSVEGDVWTPNGDPIGVRTRTSIFGDEYHEIELVVDSEEGPTVVRRRLLVRGCYLYHLDVRVPVSFVGQWARLERRIIDSWLLVEPERLQAARSEADEIGGGTQLYALARELAWYGRAREATEVLAAAREAGASGLEMDFLELYLPVYYGERVSLPDLEERLGLLRSAHPEVLDVQLLWWDGLSSKLSRERASRRISELIGRFGARAEIINRANASGIAVSTPLLRLGED